MRGCNDRGPTKSLDPAAAQWESAKYERPEILAGSLKPPPTATGRPTRGGAGADDLGPDQGEPGASSADRQAKQAKHRGRLGGRGACLPVARAPCPGQP